MSKHSGTPLERVFTSISGSLGWEKNTVCGGDQERQFKASQKQHGEVGQDLVRDVLDHSLSWHSLWNVLRHVTFDTFHLLCSNPHPFLFLPQD